MSTSATSKIEAPPSNTPTADGGATPTANSEAGSTEAGAANSKKKEKGKAKAEKKAKGEEGSGKREKKGAAPEQPVDVSRLDLRIGRIIRAWKHPDADSLYVEEGELPRLKAHNIPTPTYPTLTPLPHHPHVPVDLAEEKSRTVCSGLVCHVPLEEMQERLAMFMCNLKPAK